jgi:hypothetical protein
MAPFSAEDVIGTKRVQVVYDVPEYEHVESCEMAVVICVGRPVRRYSDWPAGSTAEELWFDSRQGLYSTASRPALGPTQTMGYRRLFPWGGGRKRLEREANRKPPSSGEVKNGWGFTSILPYVFMPWCFTCTIELMKFFKIKIVFKIGYFPMRSRNNENWRKGIACAVSYTFGPLVHVPLLF